MDSTLHVLKQQEPFLYGTGIHHAFFLSGSSCESQLFVCIPLTMRTTGAQQELNLSH